MLEGTHSFAGGPASVRRIQTNCQLARGTWHLQSRLRVACFRLPIASCLFWLGGAETWQRRGFSAQETFT
jgi:hypothetical protein